MLTTAVMAVIITAPAGAILANTLGPRWLDKKKVVFSEVQVDNEEVNKEFKQHQSKHVAEKEPGRPGEEMSPRTEGIDSPEKPGTVRERESFIQPEAGEAGLNMSRSIHGDGKVEI